jgi:hypothetical protein
MAGGLDFIASSCYTVHVSYASQDEAAVEGKFINQNKGSSSNVR